MAVRTRQGAEGAPAPIPAPCDVTIVAHDVGSVGGMERQLAELVIGLRRLGHEVTVIARTCALPPGERVTFHRVRGPARPVLFAYPWFMLAGSVVVFRHRRGVVQATGAIVLNRVDAIAVHYCHQVGPANPSRSNPLFRAHAKLAGALIRRAERICFGAGSSTTFVCVSDGVADEMRSHYPQLGDRVLTIHNGVDTDSFAPGVRSEEARALRAALNIEPARLVAVFVGSEWGRKGLRAAIEAVALAPEWDLVVAGDGDREPYEQLAESLGIARAVHWLGVTRDIQPVYELSDALVFPSSYEAFPLVALEAAASGLPILATPVSGVRELISDGESGFLIGQDPRTIAERLAQLAADPELRARLGQGARASALRFSWARMVRSHHELYSRLPAASARADPSPS